MEARPHSLALTLSLSSNGWRLVRGCLNHTTLPALMKCEVVFTVHTNTIIIKNLFQLYNDEKVLGE